MRKAYDYLVIGGGIIGLTIARALRIRDPSVKIGLIEKESEAGFHATGRSGGTLHAGFYYTDEEKRGVMIREGNKLMTQYIVENKLPLLNCGQLVVTTSEEGCKGLDVLKKRAEINKVDFRILAENEVSQVEPKAKTVKEALFFPTVSSIDPERICKFMAEDVQKLGVDVHYNTKYLKHSKDSIITNNGEIHYHKLINAAGIYADKIAHDFGFGEGLKMIPFKIVGLKSTKPTKEIRTKVYSIPDFKFPYLAVKIYCTPYGEIKISPIATPAFWRESYGGFSRFSLNEMLSTIYSDINLLLFYNNKIDFRSMLIVELRKLMKKNLVNQARKYLRELNTEFTWDKPAIIANLFDTKRKEYVDYQMIQGDERSVHILNPVFPAFTTSMILAQNVLKDYL